MAHALLMSAMNSRKIPRPSVRTRALARLILSYLERPPAAEDGLEGITKWWLLRQQLYKAEQDVQAALDMLLQRHRISARCQLDGRVYFRLNRRDVLPAQRS